MIQNLDRITLVALCVVVALAPAARGENYAVLFAGGSANRDADENHERYHIELKRFYWHLVDHYGYKPENIVILHGDGTAPGYDVDSPVGFNYSADWSSITANNTRVLEGSSSNLGTEMQAWQSLSPHDLTLVWVFDHGGDRDDPDFQTSDHEQEYICGWGSEINDDVFAGWADDIGADRQAYFLTQCYSGGVLEELDISGHPYRWGCASARHYEKSQSGGAYTGFAEAMNDAIDEELDDNDYLITQTEFLYLEAYDGTTCAPPIPLWAFEEDTHHPWRVGMNMEIQVARWEGQGAGGANTNWNDVYNWSVPIDSDATTQVEFTLSGQAVIADTVGSAGWMALDWDPAVGSAASVRVLDGGGLPAGHCLIVGDKRYGRMVQEGGSVVAYETGLILGLQTGAHGRYEISGGDLVSDPGLTVGYHGYGEIYQSGGTVSAGFAGNDVMFIGRKYGGSGRYELSLGDLSCSYTFVGYDGFGRFIQTGGTHEVLESLVVAHAFRGEGAIPSTYEMSDGLVTAKEIVVGREGNGTFTQTGGTVTKPDPQHITTLYVGKLPGSNGTYSLGGGDAVLEASHQYIGYEGDGEFIHTAGANTCWQDLCVAWELGSDGRYELHAGGDLLADNETIGHAGEGTFEQTGGTNTIQGNLVLGNAIPGVGTYTHTGGQVDVVQNLYLGYATGTGGTYHLASDAHLHANRIYVGYMNGVGTFQQTGGTATVDDDVTLGFMGNKDNRYEMSGGQLSAQKIFVGFQGKGTFEQIDGIVTVSDRVELGSQTDAEGTYIMDGGTLNVQHGTIRVGLGDTGVFTLNGGTVIADTFEIRDFGTLEGAGADGTLRVNHLTGLPDQAVVHGSLQLGHGGGTGSGDLHLEFNRRLEVTGDLTVAHSADAELTVSGSRVIAADVYAGSGFGAHGTVNLTTSTLTVDNMYLGAFGTAALDQNGGTTTVAGDLVVAGGFSPDASYTLRSSSSMLLAHNEIVGGAGLGTFTHANGTNTVSGTLTLGSGATGNGTYQLQDGTVETATLVVGQNGIGHFTQGDGSGNTVTATTVRLGGNADGHGTYELWGGQLQCTSLIVGDAGTGTFSQSSDLTATDFVAISSQVGSHGTYNLDSGDLSANLLRAGGGSGTDGTFNWNWGTLSVPTVQVWGGGTFNVSDYWAFGGAIEVTGGLLNMNGGSASLWLDAPGDGASLTIAGGAVNSWNQVVGNTQKATVTHSGGSNTVSSLLLGYNPGAEGTYLFSGGSLVSTYTDVGVFGTGTFTQSSGTFDAGETLNVGYSAGAGTYNLENGSVETNDLKVGIFGTGHFNWTGGVLLASDVEVGPGGTMDVAVIWARNGTLGIHGGSVTSAGLGAAICLGTGGGTGVIEIDAGTLNANTLCVGYDGTGRVTQTGGTVTGNLLWVGRQGPGNYYYDSGDLTMDNILVRPGGMLTASVDWTCSGMLAIQAGAAHFVEGSLTVEGPGDAAQASISGGSLATTDLNIGILQPGRFAITDASANVTVSNLLRLGPNSAFSAVPGAGVTMTGSDFRNESTDAASLAGLRHLEMTFQGGLMVLDSFEVAGKDLGATMDGCTDNFALGGLLLGDYPEGRVRLDDAFDNQPGWAGTEALYVHRLTVMGGSELNLNGLNLYYLASVIDPDALIDENGGSLVPIGIPGAAAEILGVPAPQTVEVTLSQSGDTDRGTFGMAVPGADGEMRALSCVVEIDAADLENALEVSDEDYFSLVIYYDEQELDVLDIIEDTLRPYWWDGAAWVLGGTTTGGEEGEGVFAGFDTDPGDYGLGYCGLDTGADYLWVNLNHASDYGAGGIAIPEPATLSLLAVGGMILLLRRRT